jgi:Rad3-related DNA helicase
MYLPEGWEPREEQLRLYELARNAFLEGKKFVFLDAPTGIGKSAIARALIEELSSGMVATSTKQLQDQYLTDFPEFKKLVGRSNFRCRIGKCSCGEGYYRTTPMKQARSYCQRCPYVIHMAQALNADMYVANYSSLLYIAQADYRPLLVLDEGHRVESELMSFLTLQVTQDWADRLGLDPPDDPDDDDTMFDWAEDFMDALRGYDEPELQAEVDRITRAFSYMHDTQEKHEWIASYSEQNMKFTVEFKPLRINRAVSDNLYAKGEKVLIMSATLLNPVEIARSTGIEEREYAYFNSEVAFDAEKRPVYFSPSAPPVIHSMMEDAMPWLADAIGTLLEEYPYDKGLVHTSSVKLAKYIKTNAEDPDNRLVLAHGRDRLFRYNYHVTSAEPTVLLSPSMTEGVDLKGDLARFIVLAKCPFMSLGDRHTARRAKIDSDWYKTHAVRQIIQACGRGTRDEGDTCDIYVLDSKVSDLLYECEEIVPQWFWDAWIEMD